MTDFLKNDKKIDPRVRKTKRAIRSALKTLLTKKDLDEITVKEISEVAEINRKTFYNHYDDMYHLVEEIEDEMVDVFTEALNQFDFSNLDDSHEFFHQIHYIFDNKTSLRTHLKTLGFRTSVVQKVTTAMKKSLMDILSNKLDLDKNVLAISIEYWAAGTIAVFERWYRDDINLEVEQIIDTLENLSYHGFLGFIMPEI
ncbi:MAG: TetR family transcriptional regulator [Clostridiaceae bacterium]|nr:TetR family transcriptional regulator [Clostridiaceae bacterium]